MKKTLQHLAILASTFVSVACNATHTPSYPPAVPTQTDIGKNPNMSDGNNLRGTPAFKKTTEYDLLRSKLLNAWMPMCELTEGFFPYIYRCSAGKPTVGIGTNIVSCSIPVSDMPLYTTSGKRLTTNQIRSWMGQTAGQSKAECRKLAARLGYRGISHADAVRLAHKEAALKVDLVHDAMLDKHGMELFDQPLPIQVLILDLAYQRGHNGVFRNNALWNCLKNKDYANAHRYVVCCTNKKRNTIKRTLVNLAHTCKQGMNPIPQLTTLERFNIRFNPADLDRHIFTMANTNYYPKRNIAPQSANRNTSHTSRRFTSKRSKRARRG